MFQAASRYGCSPLCALPAIRAPQRQRLTLYIDEQEHDADDDSGTNDFINRTIPALEPAAILPHHPSNVEYLVNPTRLVTLFIGRSASAHKHSGKPAVKAACPAIAQRPLHITKENSTGYISIVISAMDVGLVKDDTFTVAPAVALTIHFYVTTIVVWGIEPQVIT